MQRAGNGVRGERMMNGVGTDAGLLMAQISVHIVDCCGAIAAKTRTAGRARECGPAADMASAAGKPCPARPCAGKSRTTAVEAADMSPTSAHTTEMTATTEVATTPVTATAVTAAAMTAAAVTTTTAATRGGARKRNRKHNHGKPFDL
jgi:hypothetical protein